MPNLTRLLTRPSTLAVASSVAFSLALLTAPAAAHAQQMFQPEPISADAPTAKQAKAIAELILAGDKAKVVEFLSKNAAPAFKARADYDEIITRVVDAAKTGARHIVQFDGLGKVGVGVALGDNANSSPTRAIVVQMDPETPHHITGLQLVNISMQGEPSADSR